MSKPIRWGILGPGRIAGLFTTDLAKVEDAVRLAVGSRSQERAAEFAAKHGFQRAYGSYEELARDPEVDAVYVASPHPFHKEHAILCMEHGKAVLCEKPMEINAQRVREMAACARANGVFLMEAMWTRFNPTVVQARRWLAEGAIGEPRLLTADFGFRTAWNPQSRLLNPELGGGALLDVGVYVVAFAYMVMGAPKTLQVTGHVGETGVDEQVELLLGYEGGRAAQLACAVRVSTPQEARIDGTEGSIYLPAFWHGAKAILRRPGQEPVEWEGEWGYRFEAMEVMECLRAGKKESAVMPLDESIAIAETLEQARRSLGVR
ncbi:MAG: Gfo/Idh/MocA family oxidoreductase, partial [Chloroflexi bacterium]|nr:Gfo/Idh/MocA family oxidoreductase [Chloroflexota bacterium]